MPFSPSSAFLLNFGILSSSCPITCFCSRTVSPLISSFKSFKNLSTLALLCGLDKHNRFVV
nr:MAG TPA: hypothetical protein [Caudoviricetes sp.]